MKRVEIRHSEIGDLGLNNIAHAYKFFDRSLGLMFKREISEYQGILLEPCNSIHTFFCYFQLDVFFLDSENRIVKIYHELRRWRMTPMIWKAKKVLEIPSDLFKEKLKIKPGDILEVKCIN